MSKSIRMLGIMLLFGIAGYLVGLGMSMVIRDIVSLTGAVLRPTDFTEIE